MNEDKRKLKRPSANTTPKSVGSPREFKIGGATTPKQELARQEPIKEKTPKTLTEKTPKTPKEKTPKITQLSPKSLHTQLSPKTPMSPMTPIKYTEQTILELLSDGYVSVHPKLWDYIPNGAHIRYFKRGPGDRCARFKPGGYVKSHFLTDDKRKMIMIESRPNGKQGSDGYLSYPIAYDEVSEIWKRYDRNAFIEIHLIYGSLAQKKQQVIDLEAKVTALNDRIAKLENILAAVIIK